MCFVILKLIIHDSATNIFVTVLVTPHVTLLVTRNNAAPYTVKAQVITSHATSLMTQHLAS